MPTSPQARVIPMPRSVINVLTASRLACGLATFGSKGPEAQPCPASISQQLLELVVLLLQFLQALGVRDGHTAELRLPVVVGGLRDPVLAAQFGHLGPCLGLLQHPDDLFFRKSFLHCRSFVNGLYIDFVLTTGSRSGLPSLPEVSAKEQPHQQYQARWWAAPKYVLPIHIGPSDRWRGDTPENHDDQRYPAPNRIGHSKAKATSRRGPASARRLNNTFRKSLNRRRPDERPN